MRSLSGLVVGLGFVVTASIGCGAPSGEGGAPASLEPWARSFAGSIEPERLVSGSQGDLLFGGTFHDGVDFGAGTLTAEPQGSVFIAHLDAAGDHLFSGSTGASDLVNDLAIGPEGDLYVAGRFDGLINFGSGKLIGSSDGYLAAFGPGGASSFSHSLGSDGTDQLDAVATTPGGDILVAGIMSNDADLGGGAPSKELTEYQTVIAAFSRDGAYLWELRLPDVVDGAVALAVDGAGDILLSSHSYQEIHIGELSAPAGAFVAKLGPQGEPLWLVSSQNDNGDIPSLHDLITGPDGSVFVSGSYQSVFSFGGLTTAPPVERNSFFLKLSKDGKALELQSIGRTDYGDAPDLALLPGGDLLLAMTAAGRVDLGDGFTGTEDSYNAFLARYSPGPKLVETMELGAAGSEAILDLAVDPNGQAVVVGLFSGELDVGDTHLVTEPGITTTFLARIDF